MVLKPESEIFMRIPDDHGKQVLHPGLVVSSDDESVTVRLMDEIELQAELELFVHYEIKRQFMQQPVTVETVDESEDADVVRFLVTGEAFSAESRERYRVSAIASDAALDVGSESDCKVLDVSGTGFSFYAQDSYAVAQSLSVHFTFGDKQWPGTIVIMSAKDMDDKKRYGVRCTDGPLKNEIAAICREVERQQLRRLAGHVA